MGSPNYVGTRSEKSGQLIAEESFIFECDGGKGRPFSEMLYALSVDGSPRGSWGCKATEICPAREWPKRNHRFFERFWSWRRRQEPRENTPRSTAKLWTLLIGAAVCAESAAQRWRGYVLPRTAKRRLLSRAQRRFPRRFFFF